MDTLWQDLRFSLRMILRSLGFSVVAISTLTLGIAATSSVTTVVSAVLLQDLPYPEPDRLIRLETLKNENGALSPFLFTSYLDYQDWKAKLTSFTDVGVHSNPTDMNLLHAGAEPQHIYTEVVDSTYFRITGVRPELGRAFTSQDDAKPGEPHIAILSHALWQSSFGGNPQVLGKNIAVDGQSYEVVGVMPARFRGLTDQADLWLPVTTSTPRLLERRATRWLHAVARLKPGVSVEQAQKETDGLVAALAKEYPDTNEDYAVTLKTLRQSLFGDLRFPLFTLLGASTFVLLIAWTTVANLLLARATARQREIAVRYTLGATRGRLTRQLLTESLVLAGISAILGLILSQWATRVLLAASTVKFQSFVDFSLNPLVVTVIVSLSLLCGVVFGLAPSWLGIRQGASTLREGNNSKGVPYLRFQSGLVIAEVALTFFLLIGAGLMIRGFQSFRKTELGFNPKDLLTVRVGLRGERYADDKVLIQMTRQYHERLSALPGVKSVSIEAPTFPTEGWFSRNYLVEDLVPKTEDGLVMTVFHNVTPGYFRNMGIPLTAGRDFSEADTDTSPPVVVVSQSMARRCWPGESPIGKRIRLPRGENPPWITVIGVVGDLKQESMQELEWPGPDVYFSALQSPSKNIPLFTFLIRPEGVPPLSLVSAVERELRAVAPDAPPYEVDTLENRLDKFAAKKGFLVLLMSLFAGLALFIAVAGLYGVLFYAVTQRTREFGIRVALGAQTSDVVNLVVGRAAVLAAIGLAIGLVAALAFNRLFQSLFYGVSPTDLLTLLGTSVLLFAVSMSATYFPARQATKVQPTIALKTE